MPDRHKERLTTDIFNSAMGQEFSFTEEKKAKIEADPPDVNEKRLLRRTKFPIIGPDGKKRGKDSKG